MVFAFASQAKDWRIFNWSVAGTSLGPFCASTTGILILSLHRFLAARSVWLNKALGVTAAAEFADSRSAAGFARNDLSRRLDQRWTADFETWAAGEKPSLEAIEPIAKELRDYLGHAPLLMSERKAFVQIGSRDGQPDPIVHSVAQVSIEETRFKREEDMIAEISARSRSHLRPRDRMGIRCLAAFDAGKPTDSAKKLFEAWQKQKPFENIDDMKNSSRAACLEKYPTVTGMALRWTAPSQLKSTTLTSDGSRPTMTANVDPASTDAAERLTDIETGNA